MENAIHGCHAKSFDAAFEHFIGRESLLILPISRDSLVIKCVYPGNVTVE